MKGEPDEYDVLKAMSLEELKDEAQKLFDDIHSEGCRSKSRKELRLGLIDHFMNTKGFRIKHTIEFVPLDSEPSTEEEE